MNLVFLFIICQQIQQRTQSGRLRVVTKHYPGLHLVLAQFTPQAPWRRAPACLLYLAPRVPQMSSQAPYDQPMRRLHSRIQRISKPELPTEQRKNVSHPHPATQVNGSVSGSAVLGFTELVGHPAGVSFPHCGKRSPKFTVRERRACKRFQCRVTWRVSGKTGDSLGQPRLP